MDMPKPKSLEELKRLLKLIDDNGHEKGIMMFNESAPDLEEEEENQAEESKSSVSLDPEKVKSFLKSFKKS